MIEYCERKFQERFHRSWRFSTRQRTLLMDLDKSVAIMDCVAGAGKTTILLAMAMWTLKRNRAGYKGCFHYMAENQELVDDFHNRLQDLEKSSDGIFPLGYDQAHGQDRLSEDLRQKLKQSQIPFVDAVCRLEDALDFLVEAYKHIDFEVDPSLSGGILDLLTTVLTAHHVVTHKTFYSEMRKEQAELLKNPAVLVSTTSAANKLNSGSSAWSRTFGTVARTLSVPDEIQNLSHLEVLGVSTSLSSERTSHSYRRGLLEGGTSSLGKGFLSKMMPRA